MTIIATWYDLEKEQIWCLSDTRLSNGQSVLTDNGAKTQIIPIVIKHKIDDKKTLISHHSLGFAFCGSSLIANNVHSIASVCTQQLVSFDKKDILSVNSIVEIYKSILYEVTRRANENGCVPHMLCEAFVFGYCLKDKCFKIFKLTNILEPEFNINCEELATDGRVHVIGSGKSEFIKQFKKTKAVNFAMEEVISSDEEKGVGGMIQYTVARNNGVNIKPVAVSDEDNKDKISIKINGVDVSSIKTVDGFHIGDKVIGDLRESQARHALKFKGIDPDKENISKELQNTASLELCCAINFEEGKGSQAVVLDDIYFVDKINPGMGEFYFVGKCYKCNQNTPLLLDLKYRLEGQPFKGGGGLRSHCYFCGECNNFKASEIYSLCWNLPTK